MVSSHPDECERVSLWQSSVLDFCLSLLQIFHTCDTSIGAVSGINRYEDTTPLSHQKLPHEASRYFRHFCQEIIAPIVSLPLCESRDYRPRTEFPAYWNLTCAGKQFAQVAAREANIPYLASPVSSRPIVKKAFFLLDEMAFLKWKDSAGLSYVFIRSEGSIEETVQRLHSSIVEFDKDCDVRLVVQSFTFDAFDCRRYSVEAMLSNFLAELAYDVILTLDDPTDLLQYLEEAKRWSLDEKFFLIKRLLSSPRSPHVVWILGGMDQGVTDYDWFYEKLKLVGFQCDLDLKVAFVGDENMRSKTGATHFEPLDLSKRDCRATSNLGGVPDDEFSGLIPLQSQHPWTLRLIRKNPSLLPVAQKVNLLLWKVTETNQELYEALKSCIFNWDISIQPMELDSSHQNRSNYLATAILAHIVKRSLDRFQGVDSYASPLGLVASALRPIRTYELEDFQEACPWKACECTQLNCLDLVSFWFPDLLTVKGDEVHLSNSALRGIVRRGGTTDSRSDKELTIHAHHQLLCLCLKYLTSTHGKTRLEKYEAEAFQRRPTMVSHDGFLAYATLHWPQHAKLAREAFDFKSDCIRLLVDDKKTLYR